MHIAVAGASGDTGQHVVRQGIEAGHQITALVRDADKFRTPDGADVREVDVVAKKEFDLPQDVDAVISTLGKRSFTHQGSVCERGVANLLAAMRPRGIRRIVTVSASPVLRSSRAEPWWFRATMLSYVRWSGRHVYADLARMEAELRGTDTWCQWTIVRPGFLTDAARPGEFRLAAGRNVHGTTRRPDLAAALLELARDESAVRHDYGIASP